MTASCPTFPTPALAEIIAKAEFAYLFNNAPPASPISRNEIEKMFNSYWMLSVQPLAPRHYVYRDEHIFSAGGYFVALVFDGKQTLHLQDATLYGIVDQIDATLNTRIARQAVDAVIYEDFADERETANTLPE